MQYKTSSGHKGLARFQVTENEGESRDWRRWPYLCIGLDMGSDGLAGLFAAQYKFGLNIEGFCDPSHGGKGL